MKITQTCSAILLSFTLFGCHVGGSPAKFTSEYSKDNACNYESLPGKSYIISEHFKPYITLEFFFNPEKEKYLQSDENDYERLITQKFKIVETGIITAEDLKYRAPYLERHRYKEEEIDGELYKRDRTYSTKLVTEDCTLYYLSGEAGKSSILPNILNEDGSKVGEKDVLSLIGTKPLQKADLNADIKFDKFEKIYKVSTPFFKDQLLRGVVSAKNNEIINVQLYTNLKFLGNWGNIQSAIDTDGTHHEVTKISSDTDCSSQFSVCHLTETIGITLSPEFLEKNKDGFEIKASGTQERIISVPGNLVKSFLTGIDKAISMKR